MFKANQHRDVIDFNLTLLLVSLFNNNTVQCEVAVSVGRKFIEGTILELFGQIVLLTISEN